MVLWLENLFYKPIPLIGYISMLSHFGSALFINVAAWSNVAPGPLWGIVPSHN